MSSFFTQKMFDTFEKNKVSMPRIRDYFSWGRDRRHNTDNSEDLKINKVSKSYVRRIITKIIRAYRFYKTRELVTVKEMGDRFCDFEKAYEMLSDEYSRTVFCETLLSKHFGEDHIRLSSFSNDFIANYEISSEKILNQSDFLRVYTWDLGKVQLSVPKITIYTCPTILNTIESLRCYTYKSEDINIAVELNDIVIDCGVGWGDTTTYLASLAGTGGKLYAFDILKDAFDALDRQLEQNPKIQNVKKIKKAVSDKDDQLFYTADPSPGAKIVDYETPFKVTSISIDTFVEKEGIPQVDFIKMDIEGAERDALKGAENTIRTFKPKLAISIYHLNDDYSVIPEIIYTMRPDYEFYLDCTTGFGGETLLFCR